MENWEIFENECYEHLKNNYKNNNIEFIKIGGYDSTKSDVLVINKRNNREFYIEIKANKAQCGQFVLIPNIKDKKFEFSKANHSPENTYVKQIIKYMNYDFNKYIAGDTLDCDNDILSNWIVDYYKSIKNVKFFMSKGNNYLIFPVEKFSDYFSITAKYRVKRSGSSNPSTKHIPEIKRILEDNNYSIIDFDFNDKHKFIYSNCDLDGLKLWGYTYQYYFKKVPNTLTKYQVTKLSNTLNMNVIFSIELKKEQNNIDLNYFINDLK